MCMVYAHKYQITLKMLAFTEYAYWKSAEE